MEIKGKGNEATRIKMFCSVTLFSRVQWHLASEPLTTCAFQTELEPSSIFEAGPKDTGSGVLIPQAYKLEMPFLLASLHFSGSSSTLGQASKLKCSEFASWLEDLIFKHLSEMEPLSLWR